MIFDRKDTKWYYFRSFLHGHTNQSGCSSNTPFTSINSSHKLPIVDIYMISSIQIH